MADVIRDKLRRRELLNRRKAPQDVARPDLAMQLILAEEQGRIIADELKDLIKSIQAPKLSEVETAIPSVLQTKIFVRTNYHLRGFLTILESHYPGALKEFVVMAESSDFQFSIRLGGVVNLQGKYEDFMLIQDYVESVVAFYDDDNSAYVLILKGLTWASDCIIAINASGLNFPRVYAVWEETATT